MTTSSDGSAPEGGLPALESLSVTSAGDASLALVPPFCPGIFDYYVQCTGRAGGGPNTLTVSAKAAGAAKTSLAVESPGGALAPAGTIAAMQTATVPTNPNQAVVVTASLGGASQEYWVRCIPDDFPEMQWTTHDSDGGPSRTAGYYLWGTMSLPGGARGNLSQESAYAIVLDTHGVPVWYRYDNSFAAYDVETLTPGSISFAGPWQVDHLGGGTVYPVADSVDGGSPVTPDEHELRVLPNGHYLALSSQSEIVDLTGLSVPNSMGGVTNYGPNTPIYGCYVQEFDASGHLYWEWSATDHFDPVKSMVVKGTGQLASSQAEPFHCNAIDVDPGSGDIMVSARHMASVFMIDKATGKVLWVMGALPHDASKDNPIYVDVDDPFTAQHDARFQPGWRETCAGGSGQISLFDDESYTTNPARGVLYDVNIAGGCGSGGPSTSGATKATRVWQFKNTFNGGVPSDVCGSFRISSDGSRVIGWGQSLPSVNGLVFTEVDSDGHDLLDLVCPDKSSSYRAVKVPLDAFSLATLHSTAGM